MLNKLGTRELAYVAKIAWVRPIQGADNIELVGILGWTCIAKKNEFKEGDLAIYFEIDSKLPATEWSEFLASKNYKVKTMKLNKFKVISQGLALPASAFGGICYQDGDGQFYLHFDKNSWFKEILSFKEGDFLTEKLKVTYSVEEDNKRKANVNPDAKLNAALGRHPKIAKKYGKIIKRNKFLRWIFLLLFGRKKDNATSFPTKFQYVKKSDEERCENMPWILENKTPFIKTTKIDGTSTLFILERKPFNKREFYVCSRNVRQLTPNQKTYHSDNVYWSVEFKYHIKDFLEDMLKQHPEWTYVALQGETAGIGEDGGKIQGDPHKFGELRFFGYNFIDSVKGRWNSIDAKNLVSKYGIEWVPIVDENYILPDNFEEFKLSADGLCEAPGATGLREGYVYRNAENPNLSFKNVSRKYLLKYS